MKVSLVREGMKHEMHHLHKTDPEKWSLLTLSEKFGTSMERTRAIIYLMQQRDKAMAERNVLEIPRDYIKLYEKHMEDPAANTPEVLSEMFNMEAPAIKEVLDNMKWHEQGFARVEHYETL